jgi:hypothetical protein
MTPPAILSHGVGSAALKRAVKSLLLMVTDLTRIETTEGLQRAVDQRLARLVEKARREWESRFPERDPSDACVSVHITTADAVAERKGVRGSGPVKSSRKRERPVGLSLRRFAH